MKRSTSSRKSGSKGRSKKQQKKKKKQKKQTQVKMKMHGMSFNIPAELTLEAGAPFEGRERPATMKIPEDIQELLGPLAEVATNAWRLKIRMIDAESGEPKEETSKLYRFVEGLFRALEQAGVQVIDKTGKPYDQGMAEKVISFEQTPGLAKEEIIDTVRPTIRWKERPLCNGEIIVGLPVIETPREEAPTAATESAAAAERIPLETPTEPEGSPEAVTKPSAAPEPDTPERPATLENCEPSEIREGERESHE